VILAQTTRLMKETTTALRRKKEKSEVENVDFLPYKSVQTPISVPDFDLGAKALPCGPPL